MRRVPLPRLVPALLVAPVAAGCAPSADVARYQPDQTAEAVPRVSSPEAAESPKSPTSTEPVEGPDGAANEDVDRPRYRAVAARGIRLRTDHAVRLSAPVRSFERYLIAHAVATNDRDVTTALRDVTTREFLAEERRKITRAAADDTVVGESPRVRVVAARRLSDARYGLTICVWLPSFTQLDARSGEPLGNPPAAWWQGSVELGRGGAAAPGGRDGRETMTWLVDTVTADRNNTRCAGET